MTSSAMRYGLILGAVLTAVFLLSTRTNNITALIGNVLFIYSIVLVYRYAVRFRETENNGAITYGGSFIYITLLYFFASIISGIVVLIYCKFIDPAFLPSMLDKPEYQLLLSTFETQTKMPQEEIKQTMQTLLNPTTYTMEFIWGFTFMGAFIGLIMSVFVKKSPKQPKGE